MMPTHPTYLRAALTSLKNHPPVLKIQLPLLTPCITASRLLSSHKPQQQQTQSQARPITTSTHPRKPSPIQLYGARSIRLASTSPATSQVSQSQLPPQSTKPPPPPRQTITVSPPDPTTSSAADILPRNQTLTWNDFLSLRKTRRRYNLAASFGTSLFTTAMGVSTLAQQNLDQLGIFGLDPFIVLGMATGGSGAVGWLLGPFVGNAVFGFVHRGVSGEVARVSRPFNPCSLIYVMELRECTG